MSASQSLRRTITVFALAGLIGPGLALLSSVAKLDTTSAPDGSGQIADFVYHFVLLVWPPQLLGVVEAVIGTVAAVVITVGLNILLFVILGGLRHYLRTQPAMSLLLWLGASGASYVLALWASGNDTRFLNIPALLVASAMYAALIWTTRSSSSQVTTE